MVSSELLLVPPPIVIVPLLNIYLTPISEACDVPFQTTHDHNIGFWVGVLSPPHRCDNQITKSLFSNPTGHERSPRWIREGQSGTGKGVSTNSADNRGEGRVEAGANCRGPSMLRVLWLLAWGCLKKKLFYQGPYPLSAAPSPSTAIFPLSIIPPILNPLAPEFFFKF
jgi:hypothetical protein